MKLWTAAEKDFLFRDARVPRRQLSMCLQTGTSPLRKPEDHHRVNTFYTSLDKKVLAEIEIWLNGNDQDVLCALGDITLSDSPTIDSFDLVAR